MSYPRRYAVLKQHDRTMTATRAGVCAETGAAIKAGDRILWSPSTRAAYCATSKRFAAHEEQQRLDAFNSTHNMPDANW